MNPKVVCIGGGHGLSVALRAVRQLTEEVVAIATVADDGGSSGALRRQLGIPAPGDLRMAIAALADDEDRAALLQYRFKEGELAGHPLGNLLITALADLRGDFTVAVEEVARMASVRGRVLPSTTASITLAATVGGAEVRGQVAIARGPGPVERLRIEPEDAEALPAALDAIAAADLVVLGPGSLFTSVIATMLVGRMREALAGAKRTALVLNLTEQAGETLGMDAAANVRALLEHCPSLRLDAVLCHDGSGESLDRALAHDPAAFSALQAPAVVADVRGSGATHDADKLARVLKPLLA